MSNEIFADFPDVLTAEQLYRTEKRHDRNHAVYRKQPLNCFIGPPLRRVFFWAERMGFERTARAKPGNKVSGGHFVVRGRIPAFPNAVRRTVGGKANYLEKA